MNWEKGCRHLQNPNREGSAFVMNYVQALAHLKDCRYTPMKCPFGCQDNILEVDLDKHKGLCDYSTDKCT